MNYPSRYPVADEARIGTAQSAVTECKMKPIEEALCLLGKELDDLARSIEASERIFDPVCLPEPPSLAKTECAAPIPVESAVLRSIREIGARVSFLSGRVMQLNGRAQTG